MTVEKLIAAPVAALARRSPLRGRALAGALLALGSGLATMPRQSQADVTLDPAQALRSATARAQAGIDVAAESLAVPGFDLVFLDARADPSDPTFQNSANAEAVLNSSASPTVIAADGYASGFVQNGGSASAEGNSIGSYEFDTDECVLYTFDGSVGLVGSDGRAQVDFFTFDPITLDGEILHRLQMDPGDPPLSEQGQRMISPGRYKIEGFSVLDKKTADGDYLAPFFIYSLGLADCLVALILQQPLPGIVPAGGTGALQVGTSPAATALESDTTDAASAGPVYTFEWHHNGQPLVDDGRITGATTDTLEIHSFGAADRGAYSVLVSDGASEQLSSLAVLELPEPGTNTALLAGIGFLLALSRRRARRGKAD